MVQLHKRNQRIELTVQESKRTVEESHSTIQRLESMLEAARIENQRYRQQEETERAEADDQSLETFKGILEITNYPTAASDPDIIHQKLTKAFASHERNNVSTHEPSSSPLSSLLPKLVLIHFILASSTSRRNKHKRKSRERLYTLLALARSPHRC